MLKNNTVGLLCYFPLQWYDRAIELRLAMLKQFRDLTTGDRVLAFNKSKWVKVLYPPIVLDITKPEGLWRIQTDGGKWFAWASTEVVVK